MLFISCYRLIADIFDETFEAEIEAERGAVALMALEPGRAAEAFSGVIRRSVGLMSRDMGLLQRAPRREGLKRRGHMGQWSKAYSNRSADA